MQIAFFHKKHKNPLHKTSFLQSDDDRIGRFLYHILQYNQYIESLFLRVSPIPTESSIEVSHLLSFNVLFRTRLYFAKHAILSMSDISVLCRTRVLWAKHPCLGVSNVFGFCIPYRIRAFKGARFLCSLQNTCVLLQDMGGLGY